MRLCHLQNHLVPEQVTASKASVGDHGKLPLVTIRPQVGLLEARVHLNLHNMPTLIVLTWGSHHGAH